LRAIAINRADSSTVIAIVQPYGIKANLYFR